ncbi:MAG: RNA polymerase sigma factor [Oscillospiraceae bacterium]
MNNTEIINKYTQYIYAFAFSNLKNKSDAEDITQDVLIQYITKSPKLESEEHIKHWLLKVTANLCRNFHKSGWKRYVSFLEESYDNICSEDKNFDRKIILDDAMNHLNSKYHSVIHLFYYEELSISQIGEIMNMNQSTVRTRLKRGREQLKKILEERGISIED